MENLKSINLEDRLQLGAPDHKLIDELITADLPVILWGAGSMSYNTRKMLKHYGVVCDAI